MDSESKVDRVSVSREVIEKTFSAFFDYVAKIVGETKALEFALNSHRSTEKYYGSLALISFDESKNLSFVNPEIYDREILGFSLWMQKFIRELKDYMIGIGTISLTEILGPLEITLKSTGFLEYYTQAEQLKF